MILDAGPASVAAIAAAFAAARTLVWNGPLGAFEIPPFDAATVAAARQAAALTRAGRLVSVAGGGDTVAALNASGVGRRLQLRLDRGRRLPGMARGQDPARRRCARSDPGDTEARRTAGSGLLRSEGFPSASFSAMVPAACKKRTNELQMFPESEPRRGGFGGAVFAIVVIALMCYLTFAALQGEHGLFSLFQVEAQESRCGRASQSCAPSARASPTRRGGYRTSTSTSTCWTSRRARCWASAAPTRS